MSAGPDAPEPAGYLRTVSSREVYRSDWMTVREDTFVRADGVGGVYGTVVKRDFAVVIAQDGNGFHLVEQYRHAIGRRSWEFPQGGFPAGRTGTPEDLARAELAEETGLRAATWRHLGRFAAAVGYGTQFCDVFHATGLTAGPTAREASEADMVCAVVGEDELRARIRSGDIVDATTVAAYGVLRLHQDDPGPAPDRSGGGKDRPR